MNTLDKTAVVLLQLGGPDSLEAVEPFLYNLFCDPDIIDFPGAFLFRKKLARLISKSRAPKVKELYKNIGGKSPILDQTRKQADALKKYFLERQIDLRIYIAMRYWYPMTEEIVGELIQDQIKRLILLPLYPHYSRTTTGSSVNEFKRILKKRKIEDQFHYSLVHSYPVQSSYIQSIIDRINKSILKFSIEDRDKVHLVFSAHGTPLKLVREGDPYSHQIRSTYEAVLLNGNFNLPSTLCFQSKVGSQRWLKPSLVNTIADLAGRGVSHMLVIPIAFVSEHLETLSEIGIEARNQAMNLGVKHFEVMPALRDHPLYIQCLAELVSEKLELNHG